MTNNDSMIDKGIVDFNTSTSNNIKFNSARKIVEINGKRGAGDLLNRPKVLMYHRIVDDKALSRSQSMCVHIDEFHKQLELIDQLGYTPITFDDYRLFQMGELYLPKKPVIITFDDGYLDVYRFAFPLLKEYGMKAVVFVVGDQSLKSNTWDSDQLEILEAPLMQGGHINELYNNGFEIGVHTFSHSHLMNLPEEECLREIRRPKMIFEAVTGAAIYSFSYPYGQVDRRIKDYVIKSGYQFACGVFSGPARFGIDPFEIRRITIHNHTSILGFAMRLVSPYEYLEWMWWKLHQDNR